MSGSEELPSGEGLRARKKRLLRQRLSDAATEMFMQRGFDSVRVSEVAAACNVSEKTVYNHFPCKESLVLDRWDTTVSSLRRALAEPGSLPVEAALAVLDDELAALLSWMTAQDNPIEAADRIRRFGELINATPALRNHQRETTEGLVAAAASALAERFGTDSCEPEPQVAAAALVALWRIQSQSLSKHNDGRRSVEQVCRSVTRDVRRAARLLDSGLAFWATSRSPARAGSKP